MNTQARHLTDWIRAAFEQYGQEWTAENYRQACEDIGRQVPYGSFLRTLNQIKEEFVAQGKSTKLGEALESHEIDTAGKSELYHDVNSLEWKPSRLRVNTYGSPENPNQQVRMDYTRREEPSPQDFAAAFVEAVAGHVPKYPKVKPPEKRTGLVAEPCLFDLHMGRESWRDSTEAQTAFLDALSDLFRGYRKNEFDRVLFPIGNDFLDWDNWQRTTTKGTPMRGSEAHESVIRTGLETLTAGIDYAARFGPVEVIVVPGNHDWLLSHMLGLALEAWYRGTDRIEVDAALEEWKFRHGPGWLLALTHGKHPDSKRGMKPEALAAALPLKAPDLWQSDQYREVQVGHLHFSARGFVPIVTDQNSVVVRRVGALARRDSYEKAAGWDSNREAELIVHGPGGPKDYRSHRP